MLDAIDTYTPKRSELWNTSGTYKDSMTTPTVTINGKFWDMNQLSTAQETIEEGLLEPSESSPTTSARKA